jgi:hypothetical protein
MSAIVRELAKGEWVFVYNEGGLFDHCSKPGEYLWHGQVLRMSKVHSDPQQCVYTIWGPGGEQSSNVPASCLELERRPSPQREPAVNPWEVPVTREQLSKIYCRANARHDGVGTVGQFTGTATQLLGLHWACLVGKDKLTPAVMAHNVSKLIDQLNELRHCISVHVQDAEGATEQVADAASNPPT